MENNPSLLATGALAFAAGAAAVCAWSAVTGAGSYSANSKAQATTTPSQGGGAAAPPPQRHRGAKSAQQRKDDVLITEQLSRNTMFYGEENQQNVANAFVIVVGLGGVGSHAAHMLARSGVGKLRLVDFDQVTLSSLNRHAVATRDDVGRLVTRTLQAVLGYDTGAHVSQHASASIMRLWVATRLSTACR
jgi:hypothetical protein